MSRLLAFDELQRASQFVFSKDRRNFIIRRGLLRVLLALYVDMPPNKLIFSYTDNGKPVLSDNGSQQNRLDFSLSHSKNKVLFAISKSREIGIDIEEIRPVPEMASIVDSVFSKGEKEVFQSVVQKRKLRVFFDCWSRKEALAKAFGKGLALPLEGLEVLFEADQKTKRLSWEHQSKAGEIWTLQSVDAGPRFVAALCGKGRDWAFDVFDLGKLCESPLFRNIDACDS